jgi:acetylornithine deacetylase
MLIKGLGMYFGEINDWVEDNRRTILDLNRALVSIPSENRYPHGNEKWVQEFVEGYLEDLGCETDTFLPTEVPRLTEHPAYLGGRNYEERPNVVGKKQGAGGGKSILFSGHVDTVPLGEDPWSVDPFSGAIEGGKQYGLGIFDMKGGMAAAMMALRALNELGIRLAGDVTIETVVDEEFGGANGTLACRLRGYEADVAIIPEPSNLIICPQNQGGGMFRVSFEGKPGRSFSGEKLLNPVYAAARFLEVFREYEAYHKQKTSASKFFENDPGLPAYVQGMRAASSDLPLSDRVPSRCAIDLWIQCYPETSEEELRRDFVTFVEVRIRGDDILSEIRPNIEKLIRFLPGTGIPDDHGIIEVIARATRQVYEGGLPVEGAPFACDSFVFNLHSDTPALIWGPKGGNAHAPDEYIEVEPFMDLVKMYALTMVEWCGAAS